MSSRKKKREGGAPMPASSAGLFRFYSEETDSLIQIRPEVVAGMTIILMIAVVLAHFFLPV